MKSSKLIVFIILFASLLSCFSGCKGKQKARIGIIQLVDSTSYDANYKGFVDGLAENGYLNGKKFIIDYQNAQGEQATCNTIAKKFVDDKVDLIFAIATPAAQAVTKVTDTIPILVSSVNDPKSASLVKSNEKPDTNVTGTSDLTPCRAQIELLTKLVPNAKKVGMLFSKNNQNSHLQIKLAEDACSKFALEYTEFAISDTDEIGRATASLCEKVDAIYIPSDRMIASEMKTVSEITRAKKIPVICGDENMVNAGGLATYAINYYELGKLTAKMAAEILKGKNKAQNMPIQHLEKFDLIVNEETAKKIGLEIPLDLK